MNLFIHSRNHYRVDLRREDNGQLAAYCVMDSFGWSVLARRRGEIEQIGRFTSTRGLDEWLAAVCA